jgi:5'-3' exonuclease
MRLHVVDGTYELFRAHFSPRPGHEAYGRDLKATVGLVASLLALLHDATEAVTHVAVAFDNPIRSIRNLWFDGYKDDDGVPEALRTQFDIAEDGARALGVTVWSMGDVEADDALATAARRFSDRVEQVRILTPDKDLWQALRGDRVVLVDRVRGRVFDEDVLLGTRNLRPASVPDWLALVGDTADGIPGIDGFGEKSAAALLQAFDHIEQIPVDAREWPRGVRQAERLAATLARERDVALLYRKLATLFEDVPLREDLDDLAWQGVPRDAFAVFCDRVQARTLRTQPKRWLESPSTA